MTKGNNLKKSYKSIPSNWYHDQIFFNKELNKIWLRDWIYACHEDNLKNKLNFITIQIDKLNILIIRDKESKISAYLNACKHRGSIICEKPSGTLKSNILVCPYHQWSYNASDGSLIKTSTKPASDFDKKKYSLTRIKIKIWKGLIFFNFSSEIKWNIKNIFQYNDPLINKINIENFVIGKVWKKIVQCNWKIYWENYSECLHCPNIHPELSKLVPVYQRRLVDIKDDHNWKKLKKKPNPKYQGGLKVGSETWSFDGSAQGHKINSIEKELHSKGQIYISTWPSMFLGVYGDHIRVVRIIPLSNNKIELTAEWLFEKSTLKDLSYNMNNVTDFAELVMTQDSDACELNQKGIYNLASTTGVLMPEEYIIKNFHDWLKKKIR